MLVVLAFRSRRLMPRYFRVSKLVLLLFPVYAVVLTAAVWGMAADITIAIWPMHLFPGPCYVLKLYYTNRYLLIHLILRHLY